jgi:hypothetical protein
MHHQPVLSAAIAGTLGQQVLLLTPLLANGPGPGRRRRLLSAVMMSAEDIPESVDGRRDQ